MKYHVVKTTRDGGTEKFDFPTTKEFLTKFPLDPEVNLFTKESLPKEVGKKVSFEYDFYTTLEITTK